MNIHDDHGWMFGESFLLLGGDGRQINDFGLSHRLRRQPNHMLSVLHGLPSEQLWLNYGEVPLTIIILRAKKKDRIGQRLLQYKFTVSKL